MNGAFNATSVKAVKKKNGFLSAMTHKYEIFYCPLARS